MIMLVKATGQHTVSTYKRETYFLMQATAYTLTHLLCVNNAPLCELTQVHARRNKQLSKTTVRGFKVREKSVTALKVSINHRSPLDVLIIFPARSSTTAIYYLFRRREKGVAAVTPNRDALPKTRSETQAYCLYVTHAELQPLMRSLPSALFFQLSGIGGIFFSVPFSKLIRF